MLKRTFEKKRLFLKAGWQGEPGAGKKE